MSRTLDFNPIDEWKAGSHFTGWHTTVAARGVLEGEPRRVGSPSDGIRRRNVAVKARHPYLRRLHAQPSRRVKTS